MNSIHQFTVHDLAGNDVNLEDYKGKVLLVVNTASRCGFTPQYAQLEKLYEMYKDKGFSVLAFPSNDFAGQEPLDSAAIQEFCEENYQITFPVFEKVHVKGDKASALFQFLSDKKQNGKISSVPKWNFHKYLIDKEGRVVDYFYTITSPVAPKVRRAIERLL